MEKPKCRTRSGPGTELTALLKVLNVPTGWCESCSQRAATMDQNGVAWCRENRATIVGWLRQAEQNFATAAARMERKDDKEPTAAQIEKAKNAQRWASGWAAAKQLLWINPADPFGSMIDHAISRAEQKAAEKCGDGSCER